MKIKDYKDWASVEGVVVKVDKGIFTVKGTKGELSRDFSNPRLTFEIVDNRIYVKTKNANKRDKTMIGSCISHMKNMVSGVKEGHFYKLKICSGHFPMTVTLNNGAFSVKNFLGEKNARILKIRKEVTVKIEGDFINVDSTDKELASQTAASIEQLCKISNRDMNKFQDGIYIINKDGKEI